jgi:tetratricopeptide (TPR) repeat protein
MLNSTLEKLLKECTVRINLGNGTGTGFFVAPQLLLTCAHVVSDTSSDEVGVIWGGCEGEVLAEIDVIFKSLDLALLRLPQESLNHPCIWFDQQVNVGDACYSYGYPQDYLHGDSSSFEYEGESSTERSWLLKLKAGQAKRGASGSPVLNVRTGGVIGIMNLSRNPGTDLGARAVPTEVILKRFPELIDLQASVHQPGSVWLDLVIEMREEAEQRRVSEELLVLLRKMETESETRVSASLITVPPKVEHWQGRNSEIATISGWLSDPLITFIGIQGVGGVGKSALGAKLFHEVEESDFGFEGKFWADVSQQPDFSVFAEQVFHNLGKEKDSQTIGVDNSQVVNELLNCLNETRYLVVIDNLETLLQDNRKWQDTGYEEFFRRWQQLGHTSTILITTQEKPILSERVVSWIMLQGLGVEVGVALLQSLGIQGEFSELCEFVESMDGHPLTLKLIAGFLQEYCQGQLIEAKKLGLEKFEQIAEEALGERSDSSDVRRLWILQQHFERLEESLQQLLVDLSVYRQAFDVHAAAAVYVPEDNSPEPGSILLDVQKALRELVNRSLLIELTGNTYQFQPFVASYISHQNLDSKTDAHERAICYWESQLIDSSEWQSLKDLKPQLEIFHHQMELELWIQAIETLYPCCEFFIKGYHSTLLVELAEPCLEEIKIQEETRVEIKEKVCKVYNFIAVSLNRISQFPKSLEYSELSVSVARLLKDGTLEATALSSMGNSYFLMGMLSKSLGSYQTSLDISVKIDELSLRVQSTLGLVEVHWELAQYQKSLTLAEEAWSLLEKKESTRLKAESLLSLGLIQNGLGLSQTAFEKICQALEIAKLNRYRDIECKALRNIGNIGQTAKNHSQQQSIQLLRQSLSIAQELKDSYQEASSLVILSFIENCLKGDENSLVLGLESALELSKAINADLLTVKISRVLASQRRIGNQPEIALEYLNNALATAERLNYGYELHEITTEKIRIFYNSQNYEQVLVHADQLLQGFPDGENHLLKRWALWMKGAAEFEAGETEAGIANLLEALETSKLIEDSRTEGQILGTLSYCYEKTQQQDRLQDVVEQRLAIAKQTGLLVDQAEALGQSGAFYTQAGDYQQAISLYQDWLKLAEAAEDHRQTELALLNLGICYSNLGQHQTAIEYFERQVMLAVEDEERSIYVNGLNRLADSYFVLNNLEEAQEKYAKAEELLDELQDQDLLKLVTMKGLGLVAQKQQNYELAISHLQNALNLATHLENQQEQWSLLTEIGATYHHSGNYTEALRLFQQAWSLAETMDVSPKNLASTRNLAITYRNLSDFEQATVFRKEQLRFAKKQNNNWNTGEALGSLGDYAFDQKRYRKAIEYYGQTLPIAQEFQNINWQSRLLTAIGDGYRNLSQYSRAIEFYTQGLDLAQSLQDGRDLTREARILGCIAQSYRNLYRYSTAIETYTRQLELVREIEDHPAESGVFKALGGCYSSLSQYQRAIDYYEQSLAIAREITDRYSERVALGGLGGCYKSLKQYQRAIDYHEQSLTVARDIGDRSGEGLELGKIGDANYSLKEHQKALEYLQQSLIICEDIGDLLMTAYYGCLCQARVLIALNRGKEAKSLLIRSYKIFRAIGTEHWLDQVWTELNKLGQSFAAAKDFSDAAALHEEKFHLLQELGTMADRKAAIWVLRDWGKVHFEEQRYELAIKVHEDMLGLARELEDDSGISMALAWLGCSYRNSGNSEEALQYFQQRLDIAEQVSDRNAQRETLDWMIQLYEKLHRSEEMLQCREKQLVVLRELSDRAGERSLLYKFGEYFLYEAKQYEEAENRFAESLELALELDDSKSIANTFYMMGKVYWTQQKLEDAIKSYSEAFQKYTEAYAKDASDKWAKKLAKNSINCLSQLYEKISNHEGAIDCYKQHISLISAEDEGSIAFRIYLAMGWQYLKLENLSEALDAFQSALELAEQNQKSNEIADASYEIGSVLAQKKQLDDALNHYQTSLKIDIELNNQARVLETRKAIGDIYNQRQSYPEAVEEYEHRLVLSREMKDKAIEQSSLEDLGAVLKEMGDAQKSLECFKLSLELARESGDQLKSASLLYCLGTLHQELDDKDSAIGAFTQAYTLYSEAGEADQVAATRDQLRELGSLF